MQTDDDQNQMWHVVSCRISLYGAPTLTPLQFEIKCCVYSLPRGPGEDVEETVVHSD